MQKITLTILKNHEASSDGIKIQSYKKGEVLELGSPRLSLHLYNWYSRNSGFAENNLIEKKSISAAPENKMINPVKEKKEEEEKPEAMPDAIIQNIDVSIPAISEKESEPSEPEEEIKEEEAEKISVEVATDSGKKPFTFNNPLKRKK